MLKNIIHRWRGDILYIFICLCIPSNWHWLLILLIKALSKSYVQDSCINMYIVLVKILVYCIVCITENYLLQYLFLNIVAWQANISIFTSLRIACIGRRHQTFYRGFNYHQWHTYIYIYTVHLYSLTVNRSEILFLIDKLNKQ